MRLKLENANMAFMNSTLETFQPVISWLKGEAKNIEVMSLTLCTSHVLMSWLKAKAPENMADVVRTLDMSHVLMSWLKSVAPALAGSGLGQGVRRRGAGWYRARTGKHIGGFLEAGRLPAAERLVEVGGALVVLRVEAAKHGTRAGDGAGVPRADGLIKFFGRVEHQSHVGHVGGVPAGDVLVEFLCEGGEGRR